MAGKVTFFPVGNGDMTLIKLDDERRTTILIDMNIRASSEGDDEAQCYVNAELRDRLEKDDEGRPYLDVFVSSHPDQDHCLGADKNLHLAPIANYVDEPKDGQQKIVVKEIWSSPKVFARADSQTPLCGDAEAINKEAKRRVRAFQNSSNSQISEMPGGERIRIICEDDDGKTDDIMEIVSPVDTQFSEVNGQDNGFALVTVLGPLPAGDTENDEENLAKNRSSIVLRLQLWPKETAGTGSGECLFLTGGDAGVEVWDRLYERHKPQFEFLIYDLLQAPHHCSWRSLSHDKWSDLGEKVNVSFKARNALEQHRDNAFIVSSSKPVRKDEDNPPHERAKREYIDILEDDKSHFYCTGEHPTEDAPKPLEFAITANGFEPPPKKKISIANGAAAGASTTVYHG